jgi:hypothetical protein
MPVQRKHTREDLLALRNVFHGGVVDAAGLRNSHLLRTTWWRGDVALRGSLLRCGALSSEVVGVLRAVLWLEAEAREVAVGATSEQDENMSWGGGEKSYRRRAATPF